MVGAQNLNSGALGWGKVEACFMSGCYYVMWINYSDYEIILITINEAMLRSCPNIAPSMPCAPTMPQPCLPQPYPNLALEVIRAFAPILRQERFRWLLNYRWYTNIRSFNRFNPTIQRKCFWILYHLPYCIMLKGLHITKTEHWEQKYEIYAKYP